MSESTGSRVMPNYGGRRPMLGMLAAAMLTMAMPPDMVLPQQSRRQARKSTDLKTALILQAIERLGFSVGGEEGDVILNKEGRPINAEENEVLKKTITECAREFNDRMLAAKKAEEDRTAAQRAAQAASAAPYREQRRKNFERKLATGQIQERVIDAKPC